MTLVLAIVLAAALGGLWRRWWGEKPASWWPWKRANGDGIGYRGAQAALGLAALAGAALLAGAPWWLAAAKAAAGIGFLTACAQSVPHVWIAWAWLERRVPLPYWRPWLDGYTTFAEITAGALVFAAAVLA